MRPADLDGYTQCHFFAGVGIWSLALRSAGWNEDVPVWAGSCPCQPFSAAGTGAGFDDERHLWPYWHWLIEQCRPETVFGEQVASLDGLGWADLASSDMEATDYAIGFVDTCAAGFASFHIRQRLYFAADNLRPAASGVVNSVQPGLEGHGRHGARGDQPGRIGQNTGRSTAQASAVDLLANAASKGLEIGAGETSGQIGKQRSERFCTTRGLGDINKDRRQQGDQIRSNGEKHGNEHGRSALWTNPPHGYWRDADWLFSRDGKWRPVGPGAFPLASKATARMGRLRAYGNGLDAAQATGFIRAYLEQHMVDLKSEPAGDLFEASA